MSAVLRFPKCVIDALDEAGESECNPLVEMSACHASRLSCRNKTYLIPDGDNDLWAYAYMKGWNESEHIKFAFHNAHNLHPPPAARSSAL